MQLAVLSLVLNTPAAGADLGALGTLPLQNNLLQGGQGLLGLLGGQSFAGLLQGQAGATPGAAATALNPQALQQALLLQGGANPVPLPLTGITAEQLIAALPNALNESGQQNASVANILVQLPDATQPILPEAAAANLDISVTPVQPAVTTPADSLSASLALLQGQQAATPKEKPAADLQSLAQALTNPVQVEVMSDDASDMQHLQQVLSALAAGKEIPEENSSVRLVALPVKDALPLQAVPVNTSTANIEAETLPAKQEESVAQLVAALRARLPHTENKKETTADELAGQDVRSVPAASHEKKLPEPAIAHKQAEQWINANNNTGAQNVENKNAVQSQVVTATLSADQGDSSMDGQGQGFSQSSGHTNTAAVGSLASDAARAAQQVESQFSKILHHQPAVPVSEQMLVHIRAGVKEGRSSIKIQLDPAELGRVEVRLDVNMDGRTGIVITADNKDTLDMLQRDSRGLERMLQDAGLKADSGSLSFNLRNGGHQQQQDQQWASWMNSYGNARTAEEDDDLIMNNALMGSYVIQPRSGVDISV